LHEIAWRVLTAGGGADAAFFLGEAVGVLVLEIKKKGVGLNLGRADFQLSDHGDLMLQFDGEVEGGDERCREIDDRGELSGDESMVEIIGDPSLENACGEGANGAAAVDEVLLYMTDFGDVVMRRDHGVVGEDEPQDVVGVREEEGFEF
jgi:hypothetical protein